ncbi:hypothetical protein BDZ91DRAFT_847171 [Kalaharituber pfeilii]|nr:hypothetical protein BDZ91DRAFT_847171 [Kalaharituber pfeilii]
MDNRRIELLEANVNEILSKLKQVGDILQGLAAPKRSLETKEDYLRNLEDLIEKYGLSQFYPRGDARLAYLAQQAADRLKSPYTDGYLDQPEEVAGLTELGLYDNILFCDDSGSMDYDGRKDALRTLIGRIAKITNYLDTDGIDVRFINYHNDSGYNNLAEPADADTIIRSVPFQGSTPLGTKLMEKVVKPMILSKITSGTLKKPVLVCIVTDGEPNDEPPDSVKRTILECKSSLIHHGYDQNAVLFHIGKVGNSEEAKNFLLSLQQDLSVKKHIHVTAGLSSLD